MADHGQRAHAPWAASATARNWACAGALALGQTVERLDIESEAAAWGTACHQLSEKVLRNQPGYFDAENAIGTVEKTKSHEFEVDEEMAETAQTYVDYVRSREGSQTKLMVEQRFSLESLKPPFQAGGTCDAIVYNPDTRTLEVIDLKGGRGHVVEVTENKQLRTYALGALLANPGLKVETIISTIVQPRAPHKDGRIRSEKYHVADLVDWTSELLERMRASKYAQEQLAEVKGELMLEAWGERFLVAGSHCTFCPAEAICPALKAKALATANAFFNDNGAVVIRNQPSELDPARIAQVLDGADMLTGWLNAVRATALRLAETGTEIPGYQLVDKVGRRRWRENPELANVLRLGLGLDEDDVFDRRVRSPAQVEKVLGARRLKPIKAALDALTEKPVTGKSLVSSAKTSKPAVKSSAEAFFA